MSTHLFFHRMMFTMYMDEVDSIIEYQNPIYSHKRIHTYNNKNLKKTSNMDKIRKMSRFFSRKKKYAMKTSNMDKIRKMSRFFSRKKKYAMRISPMQ